MEVALEEPREGDLRFEVDGLPLAVPPDAIMCLGSFDSAVLDNEGHRENMERFFIRFGRPARYR
jgi:hypothetical protein